MRKPTLLTDLKAILHSNSAVALVFPDFAFATAGNIQISVYSLFSRNGEDTRLNQEQIPFGKLREMFLKQRTIYIKINVREILSEISQSVSTLYGVSQLRELIAHLFSTIIDNSLKKTAFAIDGVIDTNRKVLTSSSNHAFAATWRELNSIVFKSVIINASLFTNQEAQLKYYLPPEVKETEIENFDEKLTETNTVERNLYFIDHEYCLDNNQTVTAAISVEDILVFTDDQLQALSKNVKELLRELESTAYFAQGITIKSDIDIALKKISLLQSRAFTPVQKVRAYIEASAELNEVGELIKALQSLVLKDGLSESSFANMGGSHNWENHIGNYDDC